MYSRLVLSYLIVCTLLCSSSDLSAAERPNIVVVLADDLGYGDLACYGNEEVFTPHLDQFANEGLRFISCYAAHPNCSPSRTGLMTGRTPTRVGVHNWIPYLSPMHVRASELTIATLLRKAGYSTCHSGKWHMNGMFNMPEQPQPGDHGFDHWFSTQNNALPNHHNPDNFVRNGQEVGRTEGYSALIVADEAARWLREGRDQEKPFFLYVCFHEPHEPIASDEKYTKLYPSDDPSYSAHHGNITQMDDAFGQLMTELDELKLRDNTLVLFTSDNGPARTGIHPHGSAGPLRAKKGHIYDGGIRVPGILRWPGHTTAGTISDEPICGVDVLPTLCDITATPIPTDRAIDGTSFLPILNGEPIERETPLYWHFNFAQSTTKVAMREGDWKLLATLTGPNFGGGADITEERTRSLKEAKLKDFELYNLKQDIDESENLSEAEPNRFQNMRERMQQLYTEIQTETPTWPNWKSPGVERDRIIWPDYKK
ncbi:Arylsulfatase [Polystyrenella longa]|uniref:Arylsulfatase n=1 Tax=Polystyrenella longa TaxID=2528007 RepID=A0A518CH70_9PLAN|nr:sulfatase-like hydrolase/transferase [Polystyrenella longa]QDU78572.1 Arylsulfatase [Polystyrenella longa]